MAKHKGLQLALWIVGGIFAFFGFWVLMIIAFINNNNNIGFGMMLSIFTAPLGVAAGTRLANPKKKRRRKKRKKHR
ncbi:hypothetical protein K8R78_01195 [bacterium]|nr:hypothetical protein [bacterium]